MPDSNTTHQDLTAIYAKLREIENLASAHGNWSRKADRELYSKWMIQAVDDARFHLDRVCKSPLLVFGEPKPVMRNVQ